MTDAASAFFWLFFIQFGQKFFQLDVMVLGKVIFLDRVVYCVGLSAYAWWLVQKSKAAVWAWHMMGIAAVIALGVIPADRSIAIPSIWLLQLAILAVLAMWTVSSVGDKWPFRLLMLTTACHAVGALTYYPVCQLGVSGQWLVNPQATYICSAVLGPVIAGILPLVGGALWLVLVILAGRDERRLSDGRG